MSCCETRKTGLLCGMHILHETEKAVVIATKNSGNRKTGAMIQIWVLDSTMHPVESRRTGRDAANQCQGCPLATNQGCYVSPMAISSIYGAWRRGSYTPLHMDSPDWEDFFRGEAVRFGAYGNPSKLPLPMVDSIVRLARRHTGYFHDWHLMLPDRARAYGKYFMASTEPSNTEAALALGLRVFQTMPEGSPAPSGLLECLADSKGLSCQQCGLCDGTYRSRPLPSIYIRVHGYQVRKANSSVSLDTLTA